MLVNADFSRPVIVAPDQQQWAASPQPGVDRVMLDRVGEEKARATSIVRYAPGSDFPGHQHPGGEEILVLSGTFSEAGEHHAAGWYLRNPPGSRHQPSSRDGAILFVKLWQMQPQDQARVRIDTCDPSSWRREGRREVCTLFADHGERVSLVRVAPDEDLSADVAGGAELLVTAGDVLVGDQSCPERTWMRLPAGASAVLASGSEGATFYLKTGHLATAALQASAMRQAHP